jgi:dihydroxyacetone kinase/dihydroxyacetone kinase-like protein
MPITVQTLCDAVARSHARIEQLEDQLNAADALLGDGDTGSMLARVTEKMAATDLSATSDIGAAFNALARAIMSATGSSLGTLLATGLLALAKATKGRSELPWIELSGLIGQAIEAMRIRGGASLGDKTILDALQSVAQSLAGITNASTADDVANAAASGARAALEHFKPLPCKIGRARLFPEKSTGAHDPGMLALALLLEQRDLPESSAACLLKTVP